MTGVDREHIVGKRVFDEAGDKVGYVEFCYLDLDTEQPEWAAVNNGRIGFQSHLVPLMGAAMTTDGLQVAFSRSQIAGAPELDLSKELDADDEAQLFDHYGLQYSEDESDTGLPSGRTTLAVEEEVATVPRGSGRARFRKHVVTETVTTAPSGSALQDQVRIETVTSDEDVVDDRRDQASW